MASSNISAPKYILNAKGSKSANNLDQSMSAYGSVKLIPNAPDFIRSSTTSTVNSRTSVSCVYTSFSALIIGALVSNIDFQVFAVPEYDKTYLI